MIAEGPNIRLATAADYVMMRENQTEEAMSEPTAITEDDFAMIQRQIRGMSFVDVRQVGGAEGIGEHLVSRLREAGFETSLSRLNTIVPTPLRRIGIRFQGNRAEITLTPEVRDARGAFQF